MKGDIKTILKRNRISITKTRLEILKIFLQANKALTQNYFLNDRLLQLDRTTIFRTLNLFVEKKIILRIPAADGVNRYLLQLGLADIHSNFMCSSCKRIIPLKMIIPPKIKLPKDFRQQNIEIIVRGLCKSCK